MKIHRIGLLHRRWHALMRRNGLLDTCDGWGCMEMKVDDRTFPEKKSGRKKIIFHDEIWFSKKNLKKIWQIWDFENFEISKFWKFSRFFPLRIWHIPIQIKIIYFDPKIFFRERKNIFSKKSRISYQIRKCVKSQLTTPKNTKVVAEFRREPQNDKFWLKMSGFSIWDWRYHSLVLPKRQFFCRNERIGVRRYS